MQGSIALKVLLIPSLATSCLMASVGNAHGQGGGFVQEPGVSGAKPAIPPLGNGQYSLETLPHLNNDGRPLFSLRANEIPFRVLLEGIVKQTGRRIFIGDDVPNQIVSVRLESPGFTLPQLIKTLCGFYNLAFSTAGPDTYLVVPRTPGPVVVQALPRFSVGPPLPPTRRNWTPFQFNGQTYFVVPLQEKNGESDSKAPPKAPPKAPSFAPSATPSR